MKIIITGCLAFLLWSFLSMYLYVDILKPATRKAPIVSPAVNPADTREADSLAKLYSSMPKMLIIGFEFDDTKFTADQPTGNSVAEIRAWISKYPSSMVIVIGHTDFIGTPEYNMDLGMKRANVIRDFLIESGIPGERIIAASRGEDQPVGPHITAEGRKQNRRAEIVIKHN